MKRYPLPRGGAPFAVPPPFTLPPPFALPPLTGRTEGSSSPEVSASRGARSLRMLKVKNPRA